MSQTPKRFMQITSAPQAPNRRRWGFTLAEVTVALGMFGIIAASSTLAMLRLNNNAALSRLQTGASTVAQNQIDLILSDSPFNPQKSQVPPELTLGTTASGSSASPTVAVYTDPKTGLNVLGWMTTQVVDTGSTFNGNNLNIYRVSVSVFYQFKGRQYSVSMNTMRCSDI
ncbi:MAG: hypothetical protein WCI46_04595 [Verrucomicrobiota bacterium]